MVSYLVFFPSPSSLLSFSVCVSVVYVSLLSFRDAYRLLERKETGILQTILLLQHKNSRMIWLGLRSGSELRLGLERGLVSFTFK